MVKWLKSLFSASKGESLFKGGAFAARDAFVNTQLELAEPWAMFEIAGFEDDGTVKIEFNWNNAFIKHIDSLGYGGENEQDMVQLFFFTSQMKPTELNEAVTGDESVQLEDLPTLSENVNRIMR